MVLGGSMGIKEKWSCGFWNIGIIDKDVKSIINGDNYSIKWMKHNYRNKFFADPFPIGNDNENYYIAAEEYDFFKGKGIIVKLTIRKKDMQLVRKDNLIVTNYHLSFPFPYKNGYAPEQNGSGKFYYYDEEGKEVLLSNYPLIDPVIFEQNNKEYLFGTLINKDKSEANRLLYRLIKKDGLFVLDCESPIKDDIASSRFAGAFFKVDNTLFRPAQDCTSLYGGQVKIMKVEDIQGVYKEEEVCVVNSHNSPKFNKGLHTFNPYYNYVVVDGFQEELRLRKPLYVFARIKRKIFKK